MTNERFAPGFNDRLQHIHESRHIKPADAGMSCPRCQARMVQGSSSVSVRAAIVALVRFGLASEGEVKVLKKGWKQYRQVTGCDLDGKSSGSTGDGMIGCEFPQELHGPMSAAGARSPVYRQAFWCAGPVTALHAPRWGGDARYVAGSRKRCAGRVAAAPARNRWKSPRIAPHLPLGYGA
jgi:hypothetical protein